MILLGNKFVDDYLAAELPDREKAGDEAVHYLYISLTGTRDGYIPPIREHRGPSGTAQLKACLCELLPIANCRWSVAANIYED